MTPRLGILSVLFYPPIKIYIIRQKAHGCLHKDAYYTSPFNWNEYKNEKLVAAYYKSRLYIIYAGAHDNIFRNHVMLVEIFSR